MHDIRTQVVFFLAPESACGKYARGCLCCVFRIGYCFVLGGEEIHLVMKRKRRKGWGCGRLGWGGGCVRLQRSTCEGALKKSVKGRRLGGVVRKTSYYERDGVSSWTAPQDQRQFLCRIL